jgi:hypothetical protein
LIGALHGISLTTFPRRRNQTVNAAKRALKNSGIFVTLFKMQRLLQRTMKTILSLIVATLALGMVTPANAASVGKHAAKSHAAGKHHKGKHGHGRHHKHA